MSNFVPSVFQQKIYDFITDGNGNAVVSAVAGSGKTTTLVHAIKLIPKENVMFFAFNKSIVSEIIERVPKNAKNIEVKTLHSYGYSALIKSYPKIEIKNNKYRKILEDLIMFKHTSNEVDLQKYKFSEEILGFVK